MVQERKLMENGLFSEFAYNQFNKIPDKIDQAILDCFSRKWTKIVTPESDISLDNGRWAINALVSDDESKDPFGERRNYNFTQNSFFDLLSIVGISKREIIDRPYELIQTTYHKLKKDKPIILAERDGNVLTNITKMNSKFIPIHVVLSRLKDLNFSQTSISDSNLRLMYTTDKSFNVNVGDKHMLTWIIDSMNLATKSIVSAKIGIMRLVCLNGATAFADENEWKYSVSEFGNYEYGINKFLESCMANDISKYLEFLKEVHIKMINTNPTNKNLIDIYNSCRKIHDSTFGDQVVGWTSYARKEALKISRIEDDFKSQYFQTENQTYGSCYDIMNRATSLSKNLSVLSQIQLQDYIGGLLKEVNAKN